MELKKLLISIAGLVAIIVLLLIGVAFSVCFGCSYSGFESFLRYLIYIMIPLLFVLVYILSSFDFIVTQKIFKRTKTFLITFSLAIITYLILAFLVGKFTL